jgi:hypothetical protein
VYAHMLHLRSVMRQLEKSFGVSWLVFNLLFASELILV